jgi:hypothetical protein
LIPKIDLQVRFAAKVRKHFLDKPQEPFWPITRVHRCESRVQISLAVMLHSSLVTFSHCLPTCVNKHTIPSHCLDIKVSGLECLGWSVQIDTSLVLAM